MKKLKLKDAKPYDAPGHFKMTALRLQGKEETGSQNFWVGLSHFLPGGGAEMGATDFEKAYFVISGCITVIAEDGTEIILEPMDSLYIPPGEKRAIINRENLPCTMLVIAAYPKSEE